MRIALIIICVVAAGVLITVIAASEAISVAAQFMENECCGNCNDSNGDGMCADDSEIGLGQQPKRMVDVETRDV